MSPLTHLVRPQVQSRQGHAEIADGVRDWSHEAIAVEVERLQPAKQSDARRHTHAVRHTRARDETPEPGDTSADAAAAGRVQALFGQLQPRHLHGAAFLRVLFLFILFCRRRRRRCRCGYLQWRQG